MQYGWTAPAIPKLLAKDSPVPVTEHQAEWLETILMLGACCGLPLTMFLVDKIGRKGSLIGTLKVQTLAVSIKGNFRFFKYHFSGVDNYSFCY